MAFIKLIFHISVSYQSDAEPWPQFTALVPFVCQSLWFYLSIKNSITYNTSVSFNFCFTRSVQFPFDALNASTFQKALVVSIGIVPTLPGFWHTMSALCAKISRIRCVLSRILHSTITLEIFFCCDGITHHQISMWKFHSLLHTDGFFYFSGSYKCLGFGRSIFCENVWLLSTAVKLGTLIRQDILASTLILSYNPNNSCFSKFNTSFSNIIFE
jgi:hypothetical protein